MKNWLIGLLLIVVTALVITSVQQDIRITNLERQQLRIEQENERIIKQNEQLKRINDQNLRLMAEGGWYGDN